jgi:hypothetical protein
MASEATLHDVVAVVVVAVAADAPAWTAYRGAVRFPTVLSLHNGT